MNQGYSLRDYQIKGIERFKENKGRLLCNLIPGAGKTILSIYLKQYYPFLQKVLVLCPSSIKQQWKQEINRVFPKDIVTVLDGHYHSGYADCVFYADWIVINYDILSEKNPDELTWADVLSRLQFDLLIVDESHYITNPSAIRTQAVQKIASKIKNRVLLSGTPITRNLENMYTQLNLVNPPMFTTEKEYKNTYCSYVIKKIHARGKTVRFKELLPPTKTQIDTLKADMKNDVYIVGKDVVYAHLPETTFSTIPCAIQQDDMRNEINKIIASQYHNDFSTAKTTFSDAMRKIGEMKVYETINFCKELNAIDDRKVCIVAFNRVIVETLHSGLRPSSVFFYGGMKDEARQKAVKEFSENPEVKFFIMNCNTITGLDGLNTVCSTIVFCQIPFTWATFDQCCGRIKRANSTFDKYYAYTMVADNDLDRAVYSTMMARKNITDSLFTESNEDNDSEDGFLKNVIRRLNKND